MSPTRRTLLVSVLLTFACVASACSGDDGGAAGQGSGATSTSAPTVTGDTYSEPGPYPVGVTTLTLPSGPSVEVWYPAAADGGGKVTYDTRDFVPDSIKSLLT